MATLRDIKRRISGVKSTSKITQAMKMVSAAKLRRAQNAIIAARPYVNKLDEMLKNLITAVGEDYTHPVIKKPGDVQNLGIIVVGSDRGLAGSFNANLFRSLRLYIENDLQKEYPGAKVHIIAVGKKAVGFYKKQPLNVLEYHTDFFADLSFDRSKSIVDTVKKKFINGELDKVMIYYNEFVNVIRQQPKFETLLPIEPKRSETEEKFNVDYIFEPDQKSILDELLPKLIDIKLWRTFLESNAAEQAARMMAMDNATTNAKDLIQRLELIYNRERQASITTEMLEIVGGANALAQGG